MSKADRIKVIVGWSAIALIVVAIFVLPLLKHAGLRFGSIVNMDSSEPYQDVQEQTFSADDINDIELIWGSGDATLVPGDGDSFVVREEARPNADGSMPQQAWIRVEDGCLKVRWNEDGDTSIDSDGVSDGLFGVVNGEDRRVTIEVPQSVAERLGAVTLTGTSGSYALKHVSCQTFKAAYTSGALTCNGVSASSTAVSYTSGDLSAQKLTASSLAVAFTSGDAVLDAAVTSDAQIGFSSGDADVAFSTVPSTLDVGYTSGDVILALPSNSGFVAQVRVTSGDVTSDFSSSGASMAGMTAKTYKNGDESAQITIGATSGDLILKKNNA